MQLDYKENIPNWVCISCIYLGYSLKGVMWCKYSLSINGEKLQVSPYGRCKKWEQCSQETWNQRMA